VGMLASSSGWDFETVWPDGKNEPPFIFGWSRDQA
jgi:hypothetical protein